MTRLLAGVDRLIVFLLGLAMLVGGVWAVAFALNVDLAHEIGRWYDADKLNRFIAAGWFPFVLVAVAVLGIGLGLWLLTANLRRHGYNRVTAPQGDGDSSVTIATTRIAEGAAQSIEDAPGVDRVNVSTKRDRNRPTATMTVHAEADVDVAQLVHRIESADEDLQAALPGIDLETRYLLELAPVRTS